MNRPEVFERRVDCISVNMDAKLKHLQNSFTYFSGSFNEFKDDMGDFMPFMVEYIWDHEERLTRIEKYLNLPATS